MAIAHWVDQLGTLNPQFLRECRGRLKPRNVIAAVGLSLIFQFLLYLSMDAAYVPIDESVETMEALKQMGICRSLSWVIPYALFVLGGYYLVDDLAKEEKTGTLNFIRLSPRPALEILLGKLLGVPLLPVILVAAAVPLHAISGLLGGVSPLWLVSYYLLVLLGTAFVFSLALLFGLVGSSSIFGKQQALSAIGFAGLALIGLVPLFMLWNSQLSWWSFAEASPLFNDLGASGAPLEWLYLPVAANGAIAHLFTLGNLALATLLTWQVILRQFRVPQSTLLSKRLSYGAVAYLNVLVWGFFQSSALSANTRAGGALALAALNVGIFVVLIFSLAPTRQTLLDWLSYRRHTLTDWIWHDSSPSVVAIAVNLAIAAALVVPWIFTLTQSIDIRPVPLLLSVLSMGTSALIYASLVQIIFSTKLRSPLLWAAGVVALIAFVPPTILALVTNESATRSSLIISIWTLFGLPFFQGSESGAAVGILIGWLMQLVILLLLLSRLARNLKQLSAHRVVVSRAT
jgi:hypothetical protein